MPQSPLSPSWYGGIVAAAPYPDAPGKATVWINGQPHLLIQASIAEPIETKPDRPQTAQSLNPSWYSGIAAAAPYIDTPGKSVVWIGGQPHLLERETISEPLIPAPIAANKAPDRIRFAGAIGKTDDRSRLEAIWLKNQLVLLQTAPIEWVALAIEDGLFAFESDELLSLT